MFRISNQVLVSPLLSALLYILIFGEIVGSRIGDISGVSYIDFVVPGLLVMNIMMAAFSQTSSIMFFHKFIRTIEELLTAPLSYLEILMSYVVSGIIRGLVVGMGVFVLALFFTVTTVEHVWLFAAYVVLVSIIFSLAGILVGVWARGFEQLNLPTIFVITPLTFLGGLFNSIHMLPEKFQFFVRINPFFYFVDGIRFSMVGISESNLLIGWALMLGLAATLGILSWYVFKIGWRLRA